MSALIFYDTALMDIGAGRGILVNLGNAKLSAIVSDAVLFTLRHLCQRSSMVAEGLIGSDGDGLIGSPDALRAATEGATVWSVVGGDEIVHPVDLIHVVSLADGIALGNDHALRLLNGSAHVGLQLRTLHLAVAMDGVYFPVVVEEHAEVVDPALHVMVFPRSADILRGVTLQTLAVDVRENVELPVGIADGRCPDALAVNLLVVP